MDRRKLTKLMLNTIPSNLSKIYLQYLTDLAIGYYKRTKLYPSKQIINRWIKLLYYVERNCKKGSRYGFTREDQRMLQRRSITMSVE